MDLNTIIYLLIDTKLILLINIINSLKTLTWTHGDKLFNDEPCTIAKNALLNENILLY